MIYGYCRVSTKHQRITRQVTNITEAYPNAIIIREFYTGTKQDRPNWNKLISQIKTADTIVFDSVSRMSRNADEGFKDYKMLYELGVHLIFLNEPLINSSVLDATKVDEDFAISNKRTGNMIVNNHLTKIINEECGNNKSISLNRVKKIGVEVGYFRLKQYIDWLFHQIICINLFILMKFL